MIDGMCWFQGCTRKYFARGVCRFHYERVRGSEYNAAHARLNKARGLARRQACVDCKKPARQWSYNYCDPKELVTDSGLRFSQDHMAYSPRCVPCHRKFDHQHSPPKDPYRRFAGQNVVDLATVLEEEIRSAIAERKKAKRLESQMFWDEELDRLVALIQPQ